MSVSREEIENNMGLVYMMARRMLHLRKGIVDYEDLVNDGVLGLIHALERFDPERGHLFSTYASKCIRGYILRQHRYLFNEIWKAREKGIFSRTFSLNSPLKTQAISEDDTSFPTYGESWYLSDRGQAARATEDSLNQEMLWERMQERLSPPQQEVLELLRQGLTHAECGALLGITRQAVSERYKVAKRRIRSLTQGLSQ